MTRAAAILVTSMAVAVVIAPASAQGTFIESFSGFSNEGGWTWGPPSPIQTSGGNPGAYLYVAVVDTFAPQPRTTLGLPSEYTGDYAAQGVTSVGVDLITFDVDFSAAERPLTLMLLNDNGTPGNAGDDWGAYLIGPTNVPLEGQGWLSYDFPVPSGSPSLPAGWNFWATVPPGSDWTDLMADVDRVQFFYGDPELFFIFQQWELGLDNPRITKASLSGAGVVPPDMLMDRVSDTQVRLIWSASCPATSDYAVFGGVLGNWYSHTRIDCSDADADLEETVASGTADRYFLVVPLDPSAEGSYGVDSEGDERPKATTGPCRSSHAPGCAP